MRLFILSAAGFILASCGSSTSTSSPSAPTTGTIGVLILATSGDGSFTYTFQNASMTVQKNVLATQTFSLNPGTYQLVATMPPAVSIIRFDFGKSGSGGVVTGSITGVGSGSGETGTFPVSDQCGVFFNRRFDLPATMTTAVTVSATFTVSAASGCSL